MSDRGVARLGIIVPVSNTNLEPDCERLRPPGVSCHFARAGGYDLDAVPDSEQMRRFAAASLDRVLDDLLAVRPHAVLYDCTSATLSMGPNYDRDFARRIEDRALVETIRDAGAARVGFCSAYTREL